MDVEARARSSALLTIPALLCLSGLVQEVHAMARADPDDALQRCRYLHERIEYYTDRRRIGGNGVQMERWRKSRQRFEQEYRERRCHRFGPRLLGDR